MMKFIDFQTLNFFIQGDGHPVTLNRNSDLQSIEVGGDTFGDYMALSTSISDAMLAKDNIGRHIFPIFDGS